MLAFVAQNGPPSVCVDAEIWQYYVGGIVTGNCGNTINHAVQLVGYASVFNIPYWVIRNSWGPLWGVGGYIFLMRGANVCGVGTHVTSAKV
jgi:C1A family cysteine protease